MIHKVSNHSKGPEWMSGGEPVEHGSISKSAMSSFSDIVVKRAKTLKSSGQTYAQIAASFSITEDMLKNMIEEYHRAQSGPTHGEMSKQASAQEPEPSTDLDAAQQAYEALHGRSMVAKNVDAPRAGNVRTGGSVADNGGYHRQMGTVSKPTIFDPNVLERMASEMDNGERIRKENADIEARRVAASQRYETISGEDLKSALQSTIQSKAASISSAAGQEAHKYSKKLPMNGMSMFDEKDFERAQASAGEQMVESQKKEAVEKQAAKKHSYSNKTVTTKDIANAMINSMLDNKE